MKAMLISRDEAKSKGLKRYFTGVPCSRGHISERWVSSCCCLICNNTNTCANQIRKRRERGIGPQEDPARTEARKLEKITFVPTRPCPLGHLGKRYTKSGKCIECLQALQLHIERRKGRKTLSQVARSSRLRENNKSGFKGVSWKADVKLWRASIGHGGRTIHIGCFETAELAHQAYCATAMKLWGDDFSPAVNKQLAESISARRWRKAVY